VKAYSDFSFTSEDVFRIQSKNSSIRFANNGTYESANLENGVWVFKNLYISNSRAAEKLNLTISATDCDLTIFPFLSTPYSYGIATLKWIILPYSLSGEGTQVFNLGLEPDNSQLDVILDGEYAGRNHGWTRSDDGTLTITGATSNVTLWYIRYPEKAEGSQDFLSEHYVLIGSAIFFAFIVIVAVSFKYRNRETNGH
jgi:hypothetical protein